MPAADQLTAAERAQMEQLLGKDWGALRIEVATTKLLLTLLRKKETDDAI